MANVLDIIIVALFVFLVVTAYRKGFISTVIDTFSFVISGALSYKFLEPVSEKVYDLFVRNLVETRFTRVLDDVSSNLTVKDKLSAMIDGLPQSAVKLAELIGVNVNSLKLSVPSASKLTDEELISLAVDKIGHTVMIHITEAIVFVLLFIVIAFAIGFLVKLFKKVNDIPVLGKFNAILGGAVGLVKATVLVFVICTVFYFVVGMSGAQPLIEAINNSHIYTVIIENNPIIGLLG